MHFVGLRLFVMADLQTIVLPLWHCPPPQAVSSLAAGGVKGAGSPGAGCGLLLKVSTWFAGVTREQCREGHNVSSSEPCPKRPVSALCSAHTALCQPCALLILPCVSPVLCSYCPVSALCSAHTALCQSCALLILPCVSPVLCSYCLV